MFLYWIASENRYAYRQADIPKGVEAERVDFPTDVKGLTEALNELLGRSHSSSEPVEAPRDLLPVSGPPGEVEGVLAVFVDDRKIDFWQGIAIEEAIQAADMAQLRVFADNVASRYREIELENLEKIK